MLDLVSSDCWRFIYNGRVEFAMSSTSAQIWACHSRPPVLCDAKLNHIAYAEIISLCGGTWTVTNVILESIEPAIRALEGQKSQRGGTLPLLEFMGSCS